MRSQKIEFRQTRDFGEIINATFQFIQQNFRPLFSCILYIAGPFALLSGLSIGVFQSYIMSPTESLLTYSFTAIFVYVFAILSAILIVMATVYHFIYLYEAGKKVEVADVWSLVRRDFGKLLFSGLGIVIATICGLFLCFLPGIYLFVALIPVFNIQTNERLGFFDSASRSFKLISGHWWRTFGLWFVLGIVQSLISFVVVSPLFVAMGVISMLSPGSGIEVPPNTIALLYIVANSLNNILSILCGAIVFVAMGFHYYSLVEEKEGLGLMEKIRLMGTPPGTVSGEEEEEEEEY